MTKEHCLSSADHWALGVYCCGARNPELGGSKTHHRQEHHAKQKVLHSHKLKLTSLLVTKVHDFQEGAG
ncbi:hypothetical protein E2C01_075694 [Portunus trituberculatus]|uniref:Uncharacterized protein n=1 Tax=Portunus trituberculatus TaxID=210409 RepID=A0A5B7IFM4_PORTR|nr:hypothetical protein [Portunus trituberculatus]